MLPSDALYSAAELMHMHLIYVTPPDLLRGGWCHVRKENLTKEAPPYGEH